jgi:hypothetical protein
MLGAEFETWLMQIVPAEVHDILCLVQQQEAWTVIVIGLQSLPFLGNLAAFCLLSSCHVTVTYKK